MDQKIVAAKKAYESWFQEYRQRTMKQIYMDHRQRIMAGKSGQPIRRIN